MKATDRSVADWLRKVRSREILLPRFQRFEAWGSNTITSFLRNVLRELPVGSTLVLSVGTELPFISREVVGAPTQGGRVTELLLDGQQRVTALWRSLHDHYKERTYLVDISNKENPEIEAQSRWVREDRRFPLWVDKPEECWAKHLVPIYLLNPEDDKSYHEWADDASHGDVSEARKIENDIRDLRERIAHFNLPLLYLPPDTDAEVAIDVFISLNTTLVRLTAFDIVVAQMEAAAGESLHDLVGSLNSAAPGIIRYSEASNLVLSVGALMQNKLPNQQGFRSLDLKEFVRNWPHIEQGSRECSAFLGAEGIPDGKRLPTETVLPPLVSLWSQAPESSSERGNTLVLLRKYLFRAVFTSRYDRAVSGALLQDYRSLEKVMAGLAKPEEVPCLNKEEYPLPLTEELGQCRWPVYKDRLARGILVLSLRKGAEDIKDGSILTPRNIGTRHYHHLFPSAWLKRNYPGADPDLALNCILITRRTNKEISAKEPITYLREACEASDLGESEIRRRLATHFVDFDLLAQGNYEEFLRNRAEVCTSAIEALCRGGAWGR